LRSCEIAPASILRGRLVRRRRRRRIDGEAVLRQQLAQLVVLVAYRRRRDRPHERLLEAAELGALVDEKLALIDLGLARLVAEEQRAVCDDQDDADSGKRCRRPEQDLSAFLAHPLPPIGTLPRIPQLATEMS